MGPCPEKVCAWLTVNFKLISYMWISKFRKLETSVLLLTFLALYLVLRNKELFPHIVYTYPAVIAVFRYNWSKFRLGLHSQSSPRALPRVLCWVNASSIWIHPEGSTRHTVGFRPTQSGAGKPVPASCSCFTQSVEVNRSLDWFIPTRAFFWGACLNLGVSLVARVHLGWDDIPCGKWKN